MGFLDGFHHLSKVSIFEYGIPHTEFWKPFDKSRSQRGVLWFPLLETFARQETKSFQWFP